MNTVTPCCGGQLPDQLPDLDHARRVESVGGLIENEQFRPGQQRPGEGETLQIAERERAGPPVRVGPERQPLDDRVHGAHGPSSPPGVARCRGCHGR